MTQRRSDWLLGGVVVVMLSILVLQYTKQNMLPRSQTMLVWGATAATMIAAWVLRSGRMRDNRWIEEQRRLGTLANNYYEPRRLWLTQGFGIGLGVLGGLWWGLATWGVILIGLQRGNGERGLMDFEIATLCGAITGGVIGAAVGLTVGHIWEGRHRRARQARTAASA